MTHQNTSHAVMAQRVEPRDSFDDFPSPPWATRALVEHVLIENDLFLRHESVWEPACNRGFMVRPLKEYFRRVYASDIVDYRHLFPEQDRVLDFLWPPGLNPFLEKTPPDWIITNPPFRLGEQFILQSLKLTKFGVAVLVRTQFLEGVGRYERLFKVRPPQIVAQFTERVPMVEGRCDPEASTATAYAWLVWRPSYIDGRPPPPPEFLWIRPCRRRLERPGDYD